MSKHLDIVGVDESEYQLSRSKHARKNEIELRAPAQANGMLRFTTLEEVSRTCALLSILRIRNGRWYAMEHLRRPSLGNDAS